MIGQPNKKYMLLTILVAGLLVAIDAQGLARDGTPPKLTQMATSQSMSPPMAAIPDSDPLVWAPDRRDPFAQMRRMKERRSGQFIRAVSLPAPLQADKIRTRHEKGVVTIAVPQAKS